MLKIFNDQEHGNMEQACFVRKCVYIVYVYIHTEVYPNEKHIK